MNISARIKATFQTGIITGFVTHIFILTNGIHNYDNISETPEGVGTGATSGRWLLELIKRFGSKYHLNYNIPAFNGMLAILVLALSACIIVELLEINSVLLCILFTGIFMVYPTASSTLFFMYVAHYNMLAMLFSVLAVWASGRYRFGFLLSALFCAFSLGIYQAYFPVTASLMVLMLISDSLKEDQTITRLVRKAFQDFGILVLGFLLYLVFLTETLKYYHLSLSDYQGINEMGRISLQRIPRLLINSWLEIMRLPLQDYYGIAPTGLLKAGFGLLMLFSTICLIYLLHIQKRRASIIFGILFLIYAVFPVVVNSIKIICPDSDIYTLMVYASVFVYALPVLLCSRILTVKQSGKIIKDRTIKSLKYALAVILSAAMLQYVWIANGNYTAMYYNTEQTKNYLNSVLIQARETEGYQRYMKWAFIGDFSDDTFRNPWENTAYFQYGGNGVSGEKSLVNYYSRKSWFWNYLGYDISLVDKKTIKKLKKKDIVKEMPCYPDYGSIRIYEDMVIVKLS